MVPFEARKASREKQKACVCVCVCSFLQQRGRIFTWNKSARHVLSQLYSRLLLCVYSFLDKRNKRKANYTNRRSLSLSAGERREKVQSSTYTTAISDDVACGKKNFFFFCGNKDSRKVHTTTIYSFGKNFVENIKSFSQVDLTQSFCNNMNLRYTILISIVVVFQRSDYVTIFKYNFFFT